jgi:hypothetical protein
MTLPSRPERKSEEARRRTCAQWLELYRTQQMQSGATKYHRDELLQTHCLAYGN